MILFQCARAHARTHTHGTVKTGVSGDQTPSVVCFAGSFQRLADAACSSVLPALTSLLVVEYELIWRWKFASGPPMWEEEEPGAGKPRF